MFIISQKFNIADKYCISVEGDSQLLKNGMRLKDENGNKYFAHTLNNMVVAPPRMLIAFLENNLQEDGSVRIPEKLRPYMGGKDLIK